jgi:hypothetical protein
MDPVPLESPNPAQCPKTSQTPDSRPGLMLVACLGMKIVSRISSRSNFRTKLAYRPGYPDYLPPRYYLYLVLTLVDE